uniref:Caspase-2 n=2 Tax=Cacopsylla melanoneura TaxID=428564 RepID=A0A8D8T8Z5_9HEMI
MNECQQEKIQKYRDYLIENTRFDDLWQTLTEPSFGNQRELIFTDRMIQDIVDEKNDCGDECRNERFYDLIVTSPHLEAFDILKNALSSSGHNDLAKLLLEDKLVCTEVDMSLPTKHLALPPLLEKVKVSRSRSLSIWATMRQKYTSYVVQSSPRGYLLLINMRFIWNPLSQERKGSDVDVKNLKSLFHQLNYAIIEYQDLTLVQIEEAIEEFSHMPELAEVDSVLVFVMSHGRDPSTRKPDDPPLKSPGRESVDIETEDNKFINSNDIADKINQSSTIRPNTPRMFFFNVCRGNMTDWGPNGRQVAYNSSDHIADTSTEVDALRFTPGMHPTPSQPISSPNENGLKRTRAGPSGNGFNGPEVGSNENGFSEPHLPQAGPSETGFNGPEVSPSENGFNEPRLPQLNPNETGFNGPEVSSNEISPAAPHLPQVRPNTLVLVPSNGMTHPLKSSHVSNQPWNNIGSSSNGSPVGLSENTLTNKNKAIENNKSNGHQANGSPSNNNPLVINFFHGSDHKSQHGNTPSDTNHAHSNGFVDPPPEGSSARLSPRKGSPQLVFHRGSAPTLPRLEPTNYSTSCCCIPRSNNKDKSLARCAVWLARFFKCSMPNIDREDDTDRVGVMGLLTINETENETTAGSSHLSNGQSMTEPTVSSYPGGSQHATEPIDIPTTPLSPEESCGEKSHSPKGSATSNGSIRSTISEVFHTISNKMHLPNKSHPRPRDKLTGDIFMAFSTVDGYNSKRHPSRGSWFITFICQVFAEMAKDTDLLSMMEEVDRRMRERCDAMYGTQMYVKKTEGFSKKFFFNVVLDE